MTELCAIFLNKITVLTVHLLRCGIIVPSDGQNIAGSGIGLIPPFMTTLAIATNCYEVRTSKTILQMLR